MSHDYTLKLPSASVKVQLQNRLAWNEVRSAETADFFTIGYTGRPIQEFIDALVTNEVRTLVDVRQHPVSKYRPEFSKKNLCRLVNDIGLLYVHFPELGVPRDIRAKAIQSGSRDIIWDWYDQNVITEYIGHNLHHFLNFVEHPVALMCVEIAPQECHRHRLSLALERLGLNGFDI